MESELEAIKNPDEIEMFLKAFIKTKFNLDEFDAYANYFYAEERNDDYRDCFYKANKLHKSRNPHHYEYWANKDGFVDDLPNIYL